MGRVLTGYCEQELATDHSHSRVSQLLSPLALRKPLTVRQWARLATALSNQPCTEDDVLVVVGRLGRYLTHDEEKDTWLLRFSLQGGAYRTSDATLLPALLGLIPTNGGHERHWDSADHVYLELLAGVAARPQGVDLLDDASFLLAAPSSAIGEALRAVGKEPLLEVWHRIRHSSLSRSSRSILLALHAHAAGLTHLAEQVRVTGVPVEVQRYRPCPEDTDEITLVAVDSGSDAAHCVTVHDDEVVTIWSPSSFEVAHRLGHADIRDISACAVTTVDGEPVVVLGTHTGLVAIWDCARKELIAVEAAERIEAVSVDTDLRVAALGDGVLHMIDGRDGRALQEPVDVPDAKAVCIARTVLSVATETGLLHLWNRNSTARPTVRTAYRGGYSSALALSYDGISAAWMHDEVLWVDAPGRPAYALGRLNGVESLAVGDRWVAAVRATQDNSVRVWHLSTGQSFDVPLHEAGVAAAFTRADLLLVTTRSALVSLRLG
ncbi:WD40 repeat domain-containing protein [Lentzea chajnantorensis]